MDWYCIAKDTPQIALLRPANLFLPLALPFLILHASYCIQGKNGDFIHSNNRSFSCLTEYLLYDESSLSQAACSRVIFEWKTKTLSLPLLTLPGFRLRL